MHAPSDQHIDQLARSYGEEYTPDVEAGLSRLHARIKAMEGDASVEATSSTTVIEANGAAIRPLAARKTTAPLPAAAPPRAGRRRFFSLVAAAAVLLLLTVWWNFADRDTTLVAEGENLETTLPDGTRLILQDGSTLTYAADFNETERRVELTGQAFFEVTKDAARPFRAGRAGVEMTVTGTAFNLRVGPDELEVEVAEGSVLLNAAEGQTAVEANQCGVARPGEAPKLMPAPHLNRHAWRTGKLSFTEAKLADVLRTICNNYGISVTGAEDCDFPVSGKFSSRDAEEILANIAKLGGGKVSPARDTPGGYELSGLCAD